MLKELFRAVMATAATMADTQLKYPDCYDEAIAESVARARTVVAAYRMMTGHLRPDVVCNLLNDLMHLCDCDPRFQDFERNIDWAAGCYADRK